MGNSLIFLCFGDIRRSHLDCISGPTLNHLGYLSRHTVVTMGLCGFTYLVCCVCWPTGRGRLTNFGKTNLVGVVRTYIHTDTYVYNIYICAISTIHRMCGAFREVYQSEALLPERVESPISQHTAALLGCMKSRCPRRFCRRGG